MTVKEIFKEVFDSDKEVLEKCFEADLELAEIIRKEISAIWVVLLAKGLVTKEDIEEITKQIPEFTENKKTERKEK